MGDIPVCSQPVGDFANASSRPTNIEGQSLDPALYDGDQGRNISPGSAQYGSQSSYQNMQPYSPQISSTSRQETFNMNAMANTLLDNPYQVYRSPAQAFTPPSHPLQYQMQNHGFGSPPNPSQQMHNVPYNMQYPAQYQGMYMPHHGQMVSSIVPGAGTGNQYFHGQSFMSQSQQHTALYLVQPGHYTGQNQIYSSKTPASQQSAKGAFVGNNRLSVGMQALQGNEYLGTPPTHTSTARSGSIASSTGQSSVVRGPPRKPRQSGHAIWIGNLPPHTDLMSLVLHVCKETSGLESLFLISKSNCAFANFKDEAACAAAQMKIHDSRFQTVRLVSRLRRSSTGSVKPGTLSSAALSPPSVPVVASTNPVDEELDNSETIMEERQDSQSRESSLPQDKYFIVKSLTVEDLELSVRNGIWATQSHNEDTLNQAYQTSENVYLIFSANKSGEYFGYAKMVSPINDDPAAAIEFAPKSNTVEDPELPKAIPTPATEFAPNGRIIDDSARGTIFWEAEREDIVEGDIEEVDETRSDDESGPAKKAWGKPFKIEWISTSRLPFYRTRGLRNPWNSNREVKIARDGTELETNVGHRLIGLFHRVPSPAAPLQTGVPIPLMGGYPPMRSFP